MHCAERIILRRQAKQLLVISGDGQLTNIFPAICRWTSPMRIPLAQRERLFYHDLVNGNHG
jgi:hypothetical protein|tara:strand:- start:139 stop:321 length:183 start_codon:yes stop_codon:yes gene_type:complete